MADSTAISPDVVNEDIRRFARTLRVVVAECLYDSLEAPESQRFLGKIANFKIRSYLKDYPYGVMPFGKHDLIGTHLLLCEETPFGLEPLMGVKAISESQCERFRVPFPGVELPQEAGAQAIVPVVLDVIAQAHAKGLEVGYVGSWAVHSSLRGDKLFSKLASYFTALFLVNWFREQNIGQIVTFGVKRFKVERFHEFLGLEPLRSGSEPLEFRVKSFFNETVGVSVFGSRCPSEKAEAVSASLKMYWEHRIKIGSRIEDAAKAA